MTRILIRVLVLPILVCLALPAGLPAASGATAASITLATVADPTFNMWAPNAFAESEVIDPLIFSGLTTWALDGTPRPDLATSWSVSKDARTWTFHLRHDVIWQDGVPFTADDVAYTFDDIALNPKYPTSAAANFGAIKTVRTLGPYTVQFVLKTPWAALPSYLAWIAPVLPRHSFAGKGNPFQLTSFNKQHPIGTGPYVMSTYVPGQSITLTRNPTYFGKAPTIQTIVFQIIPRSTAQITGLLSGNLNYITVDDPQLLTPLQSNPTITLQHMVQQNYYYVALNTALAPFKDVRVRRALSLAIDKKGLIAALLKGNGEVATGPIAPLQKLYYDAHVTTYPYDPQKALRLLHQAGYSAHADGKLYDRSGHPFTINLTAGQYGYLVPASELIQQDWQKIGISVPLAVLEWNTFIQQVVVKRAYQATVGWWITPFDPDVYPYFACGAVGSGVNISNYCNPRLDALMLQGRAVTAPAARRRVYDTMQELMATQLPLLFLFYPEQFTAMTSNLHVPAVNYQIAIDNIAAWTLS